METPSRWFSAHAPVPGSSPCSFRKVGDGAARRLMTQIGERSLDSSVAPVPVLRRHADYQAPDLFLHPRTTWPTLPAAIIFPGDQPAMPSQERCRRHDGRQLMKHTPAQFLSPDRQGSALIVIEMQPLASELFAQHAVLLLKIVDHILLSLV